MVSEDLQSAASSRREVREHENYGIGYRMLKVD
jgi:hypothetical protein